MSNKLRVASIDSGIPEGATPLFNSSGNVANASAVATLTCPTGKRVFLSGFTATAAGATAGLAVNVSIANLSGGTQTYTYAFPVGALVLANPLTVTFPEPIPATSIDTNVTVTLPAGGVGNTNAAVNAYGYAI